MVYYLCNRCVIADLPDGGTPAQMQRAESNERPSSSVIPG